MTDSPLELTEIEQILLNSLTAEHNNISVEEVVTAEDGEIMLWTADNDHINLTKMAQAIQAAMREAGSVKMTEAEKYQAYARLLRQQIDRIEQASIIPAPFEALIRLNMRGV